MTATRQDLALWFDEGRHRGATHMIVVCDQYDWTDYPVYVAPDEDVLKRAAEYQGHPMQKIMEVYDLRQDRDEQINADRRVFNY